MSKRRTITSPSLAESMQLEIAGLQARVEHLEQQLYEMTLREDWQDQSEYDALCIRVWKRQPDMSHINWDVPLTTEDIAFIEMLVSDGEYAWQHLSSE